MVNVFNESPVESHEGQNIPLSMLFTEGNYLDESLYKSRDQKVKAFIELCNNTRIDHYSQKDVVDRVVLNALQIEFADKLVDHPDMCEAVSQILLSDLILLDEVLEFAHRHFQVVKIDPTLIN